MNQVDEKTRLLRLIRCGLKPKELERMRVGLQNFELAKALGIETRGMTREAQPVEAIYNDLQRIFEENDIVEPEWESNHPVCPGVPEAEGLRWKKVDDGEPVTYSFDYAKATDFQKLWLSPDIVAAIFNEWQSICSVTFKEVKYNKSKKQYGDIHTDFDALPGNILGVTLQPRGDGFMMEDGGMGSGDITIDNDRDWQQGVRSGDPAGWILMLTFLHEVGHGIGLGHSNLVADVMYAILTARGQRGLQSGDIAMANVPYPLKGFA